MEFDKWINTKTGVKAGLNGPLGSPRGWINRAYDMKFQNDYGSLKNSCTIDFREASIGAVFYRPCKLPQLSERVMYRFFHLPKGYVGNGGGRLRDYDEPQAVIGMVLAVEPKNFLKYEKMLKDAGAEWVFFTMPQALPAEQLPSENNRKYFQYNHEEIYGMLDRKLRVTEIVERLGPGAQQAAVSYIKARWLKGHPPNRKTGRKLLDRNGIVEDYQSGMTVIEITDKYNTTKQSVYTVLKKFGVERRAWGTK